LAGISFRDTLHPRAPSLAYGDSPCEYIPVRSTAASMRPTVPQAYAGKLTHSVVTVFWHSAPRTGRLVFYPAH